MRDGNMRHLSIIWAQESRLTLLPLLYITFLGKHTLLPEVHDEKNTKGAKKRAHK